MAHRTLPPLRGLPTRGDGDQRGRPAHLPDVSREPAPVLPDRNADAAVGDTRASRDTLHLALVVRDLAVFRALSGRAFLVADKDIPYNLRLHVLLEDSSSAVAGVEWQVRLASVKMGLFTPDQMHVRAVDIEAGYELTDDDPA